MSELLFLEGFDTIPVNVTQSVRGNFNGTPWIADSTQYLLLTGGTLGSRCLINHTQNLNQLRRSIPKSERLMIGANVRFGSDYSLAYGYTIGISGLRLAIRRSTATLVVLSGTPGTILYESTFQPVRGIYYPIQILIEGNQATVYVNRNPINETPITFTRAAGPTETFFIFANVNSGVNVDIDDVYAVADPEYLWGQTVVKVLDVSEVTHNDFNVVGSLTAKEILNNQNPDSSNYLEGVNVGDRVEATATLETAEVFRVNAVAIETRSVKPDSGPSQITPYIFNDTDRVDFPVVDVALTNPVTSQGFMMNNPLEDRPWLPSDLGALKYGIERNE